MSDAVRAAIEARERAQGYVLAPPPKKRRSHGRKAKQGDAGRSPAEGQSREAEGLTWRA